jgi:hypothetical protein
MTEECRQQRKESQHEKDLHQAGNDQAREPVDYCGVPYFEVRR